jgi:hypothetical protein
MQWKPSYGMNTAQTVGDTCSCNHEPKKGQSYSIRDLQVAHNPETGMEEFTSLLTIKVLGYCGTLSALSSALP